MTDKLDRSNQRNERERNVRRAERLTIRDGVVIAIDGNPAVLVDLSTVGAQVLSPTVLRPGQRVTVSLVDEEEEHELRFAAAVVRASFELLSAKGLSGYRAGLNFHEVDPARIAAFCRRHQKTAEATPSIEPAQTGTTGSPDARKRRRAQRFTVREGLRATLNGNDVSLVDVSSSGAQVISPVPLRLDQEVRIVMSDERSRFSFTASVVWSSFEPAGAAGSAGYRTGLHFIDADRAQVASMGSRHRTSTGASIPTPLPTPTAGGAAEPPPEPQTEPIDALLAPVAAGSEPPADTTDAPAVPVADVPEAAAARVETPPPPKKKEPAATRPKKKRSKTSKPKPKRGEVVRDAA